MEDATEACETQPSTDSDKVKTNDGSGGAESVDREKQDVEVSPSETQAAPAAPDPAPPKQGDWLRVEANERWEIFAEMIDDSRMIVRQVLYKQETVSLYIGNIHSFAHLTSDPNVTWVRIFKRQVKDPYPDGYYRLTYRKNNDSTKLTFLYGRVRTEADHTKYFDAEIKIVDAYSLLGGGNTLTFMNYEMPPLEATLVKADAPVISIDPPLRVGDVWRRVATRRAYYAKVVGGSSSDPRLEIVRLEFDHDGVFSVGSSVRPGMSLWHYVEGVSTGRWTHCPDGLPMTVEEKEKLLLDKKKKDEEAAKQAADKKVAEERQRKIAEAKKIIGLDQFWRYQSPKNIYLVRVSEITNEQFIGRLVDIELDSGGGANLGQKITFSLESLVSSDGGFWKKVEKTLNCCVCHPD